MEPLDQTDDEKQSTEIEEEKLEENIDGGVDSLIQNKIKTEVKQEYVEPTSLSQVKIDPLEIKTEDVKEENVDGVVGSLIQNGIKTEDVKEEYVETEVPDFQKLLRKLVKIVKGTLMMWAAWRGT